MSKTDITLDERETMSQVTMTVHVKPNRWKPLGILLIKLGARLLGIGKMEVVGPPEDGR